MINRPPKVFLSHAREDKERFVNELVKKLRERGIVVWVDKDQILPGDRLLEKIFDEGIDKSDILIIVLSKFSVDKPWVREELEYGFIKRIQGKMKIIPIKIEECKVPKFLQSTVWQTVDNLLDYDSELEKIIHAIYNNRESQEIGTPPLYTNLFAPQVSGLTKIDVLVLKTTCEVSLKQGHPFVNTSDILPKLNEIGIEADAIYESLEILSENYYIDPKRTLGTTNIGYFELLTYGFEIYAFNFIEEFDSLLRQTLVTIINNGITKNSDLANHLEIKQGLVNFILNILQQRRMIKFSQYLGGEIQVTNVTALGKRTAQMH